MSAVVVKGAREHNLKGVDLRFPRDRLLTARCPSLESWRHSPWARERQMPLPLDGSPMPATLRAQRERTGAHDDATRLDWPGLQLGDTRLPAHGQGGS